MFFRCLLIISLSFLFAGPVCISFALLFSSFFTVCCISGINIENLIFDFDSTLLKMETIEILAEIALRENKNKNGSIHGKEKTNTTIQHKNLWQHV